MTDSRLVVVSNQQFAHEREAVRLLECRGIDDYFERCFERRGVCSYVRAPALASHDFCRCPLEGTSLIVAHGHVDVRRTSPLFRGPRGQVNLEIRRYGRTSRELVGINDPNDNRRALVATQSAGVVEREAGALVLRGSSHLRRIISHQRHQ